MNFKLWLELSEPDKMPWINPDVSYGKFMHDKNTHPFIYTNDSQMFYGSKKIGKVKPYYAHIDIIKDENLLNRYSDKKFYSYEDDEDPERDIIANYDLLGRVGKIEDDDPFAIAYGDNFLVVSFWGTNENLFNKLLTPCLHKLSQDGLIKLDRDAISTINHGTVFIREMNQAKKATPQEIEYQSLMQKLHLMKPLEKRAAMQKLGLAVGSQKNPWQVAADSSKVTIPGQKLWALNSEQINSPHISHNQRLTN